MHLITNKPWIDLDAAFDVQAFAAIENQITIAVAQAERLAVMGRVGSQNNLLDQTACEVTELYKHILNNWQHPDHSAIKMSGMTVFECYNYLKYKYQIDYFGSTIQIRDTVLPNSFPLKHLESATANFPAHSYFSKLMDFLRNSGAFVEIGRVIVLMCSPGWRTPIHTDYNDAGTTRKDQFLWINPYLSKQLFVYDEVTSTKYPITSRFATFDSASFHGTEIQNRNCYSIRVDGVFTDKFLKQTGMYNHFRGVHD